jgi:hypothetical protein
VPVLVAAGWGRGGRLRGRLPLHHSRAGAADTPRAGRKKADVIVYLDHDVSWEPGDLLMPPRPVAAIIASCVQISYNVFVAVRVL